MKKTLIGVVIIGIAVLTLGTAGFAYAQGQTPPPPEYPNGPGMMEDHYGYGMMGWNGEYGSMHDAMGAVLAEALGVPPEEVEARHDAGETLWQIAAAEGLTDEEIRDVMLSAHDPAMEDAVANGWLTEEQTEWMDAHMEQMWSGGYQYGGIGGHCGGGWYENNSRWQGDS